MKIGKRRKKNKKIKILAFFVVVIILVIIYKIGNDKNVQEETVETFSSSNIVKENIIVVEKNPEINSKTSDWNLILVNKENKIPENYNVELSNIEYGHKVDNRIVDSTKKMLNDARKAGLQPYICSSYRTSYKQEILFNKKVQQYKKIGYSIDNASIEASYWVAIPRASEHEIGLALDIVSKNFQVLDERQENTEVQKWLIENCIYYGFILRYPTNKKEITKINYEPWHYRYVGIENAKFMKEKNFCLEEYIEYLKDYE